MSATAIVTIAEGNARLLRLADILDAADDAAHIQQHEPTYDQQRYVHQCGTPACALGHWAAANPDRWYIGLDSLGDAHIFCRSNDSLDLDEASCLEFSLSSREAVRLFGLSGCNHARTAKDAATFIRSFVRSREAS